MKIPMNGNHRGSANTFSTEHRQAENELRKTRDELKRRVRESTAELAKANEKLKAEIADRKRVEQAFRERERRLHAILDTSPSMVFLKHPSGRVIYVNPRFRKLLQLTSEETVDAPMKSFPHVTERPHHRSEEHGQGRGN